MPCERVSAVFHSWERRFFLLTFLFSWCFWLIPVMLGLGTPPAYAFYALGGITPSAVGIAMEAGINIFFMALFEGLKGHFDHFKQNCKFKVCCFFGIEVIC